MKLSVKVKIPKLKNLEEKLKQINSAQFVKEVNEQVVEGQIKRLIQAGTSPVDGYGRFVQYKDKDTYPSKQKSATPVNLTLSGKMLSFYRAFAKSVGGSLFIGIISEAPEDVKTRAKANNTGTGMLESVSLNKTERKETKNLNKAVKGVSGVPQRRFIPQDGEKFTVSVMSKLKQLYAKRIKALLSKG